MNENDIEKLPCLPIPKQLIPAYIKQLEILGIKAVKLEGKFKTKYLRFCRLSDEMQNPKWDY